ncbi:MAG TPA: isoprenylcysteine carboxylmethyltransferase family protein [Candidatus Udaeobacter sp.]
MFAFVGVVLFVTGLLLRWWAIITLGRFFTVDVTIEKDHELVERGPFRMLRHPSYTGVLLAFRFRLVAPQLGRAVCRSPADWCGLHSPHECGGGCAFSRTRSALRRLHEAHETACAFPLLNDPETLCGAGTRTDGRCSADTAVSSRRYCDPQRQLFPGMFEFVIIRTDEHDLTVHRLSVLTPAHEIQLGAAFFAWVCNSYLLLRRNPIWIGRKRRCAGHR